MNGESPPPVLWEPGAELLESAEMTRFMRWLEVSRGLELEDYEELWRWSVDEVEAFWASIWDYFGVEAERPYECVLGSRGMPGAGWLPGARLSYAQHIFRGRDDSQPAIHHASELHDLATTTWGELRDTTARIAGGLRALGVEPGDRVAAYMPNVPETIAAFLACASIGAVWSSCSPDFGARSVVDRFAQIEPKVLIAVDGYRYNGRDYDRMDVVRTLRAEIGSLEHTVVMPYLDPGADAGWTELLASGEGAPLTFEQLPADHPLWVLYSSGTTGLPKAIVHGQGGMLLEHLKKLHLHLNAQEGDRVFWFTTTGWMMWNFLVGVLLTPAQIVLYDGSPGHPDLGVLWDLAERTGVTCFGTSASYIASCMKGGVEPGAGRDLVEAFDDAGRPLVGEVGELVITEPMPSMPLYFWNDPGGERLRESYFSMYEGVWRHGDWIEITDRGTAVIYGRSDSTINRGGVRMGTSEIYRAVLALDEVLDALVVDVPREGEESWMPLFVVLAEGAALGDGLTRDLARRIREECSPRHVPDDVFAVEAVPRTLSGKVLEVPVKRILSGTPVEEAVSRDSLQDPAALEWFVELAGRRRAD